MAKDLLTDSPVRGKWSCSACLKAENRTCSSFGNIDTEFLAPSHESGALAVHRKSLPDSDSASCKEYEQRCEMVPCPEEVDGSREETETAVVVVPNDSLVDEKKKLTDCSIEINSKPEIRTETRISAEEPTTSSSESERKEQQSLRNR